MTDYHWILFRGNVKKKSDYLKTSSKLEWGTHPPAQFLTIYFLTNFPPVEHPPFPWIFDKIKQFYAFKITYSNLQTNFLKSVILILLLKTLKMHSKRSLKSRIIKSVDNFHKWGPIFWQCILDPHPLQLLSKNHFF